MKKRDVPGYRPPRLAFPDQKFGPGGKLCGMYEGGKAAAPPGKKKQ
jgi:hypothetical protein